MFVGLCCAETRFDRGITYKSSLISTFDCHLLLFFLFRLQDLHFALNHLGRVGDYLAFVLALAVIRCIITQSMSLNLSLMICVRTVRSVSLIAASCQLGCDASRFTHVLTGPASQLFRVSAVVQRPPILRTALCMLDPTGSSRL